jgi:hypothetical protein
LRYFNAFSGFLVDTLLRPFSQPWPALVAAAMATAVLMLVVIRCTSSPEVVRRSRNRLTARVLELVLFRHDAVISFTALGRIVAAYAAYLLTLLRPLAFSAIPCLLILSQLSCWFSLRPLKVGETALVEVTLRNGFPVLERQVSLSEPHALLVETGPLRIPRLLEIDWRVRAERNGADWVEIQAGDEVPVGKQIIVADSLQKVSQRKTGRGWWEQVLHPAEPPIDGGHSIAAVNVRYPVRQWYVGNWEVDWVVAFLVLTIVFSLLLKRPLRVQL